MADAKTTANRLAMVRRVMCSAGVDALVVPREDEYLGEYVAPSSERLRWLSGFSGSAGMAIVLADSAAIFVDGRYTIQVREQVCPDLFEIHHLIDEPPLTWLLSRPEVKHIGYDSRVHSYAWLLASETECHKRGVHLVELSSNPIDACWQDRPPASGQPVSIHEMQYCGETSEQKRTRIGALIGAQQADVALVTQLDSIAWLLNLRGNDVPRLPVFPATALLRRDGGLTLFADPSKFPRGLNAHTGEGFDLMPQAQLGQALTDLAGRTVLSDPSISNAWLHLRCLEAGAHLVSGADPIALAKAIKNSAELRGMREAHVRDGVAVTRFLAWLDAEVTAGRLHDEARLADTLLDYRRTQEFRDLSFDTISAAGPNSAICHYNHSNGTPARLTQGSLYLVDSGAQYPDGTTDITRTISIGEPRREHKQMFTRVLRGHIALARAVFPAGTSGIQLDVLARQYLWEIGRDYDHGTGHGVGAYLSVHEGPQRISKTASSTPLVPGMVVSNEPGYYQAGDYGIRCENLQLVMQRDDSMLCFETLSLAPFDRRLIDPELLSAEDLTWLNQYHHRVRSTLLGLVDHETAQWLKRATEPLDFSGTGPGARSD